MKKHILILIATTITILDSLAVDFSGPTFSPEYMETVKRADKWAIDYLRANLDSVVFFGTESAKTSLILDGLAILAQEKLDKVASHLATDSLESMVEDLKGMFLAYPSSKQAILEVKKYLAEETERNATKMNP